MNEKDIQIVGIKENQLKTLILEIYEYRDKMSKILEEAQKVIYGTNNYFTGNDADKLRSKFKMLEANFDAILKNIKSYGEDLENVISTYKKNERINVDKFGE